MQHQTESFMMKVKKEIRCVDLVLRNKCVSVQMIEICIVNPKDSTKKTLDILKINVAELHIKYEMQYVKIRIFLHTV